MTVKQNKNANLAPDGSSYVTITDGAGNLGSGASGLALAAGSSNIGYVSGGIATTTANGLSVHKLIALATTNATLVKTGLSKLLTGYVYNTSAATKYFKLYNKATAPTVGTDVPVWTIAIAPNTGVQLADVVGIFGQGFSLGLCYALTGAAVDTDTTALTAGDVIVNLGYV